MNNDNESVNVDDINNATIRFREEADDALQVGQIIMIGRTIWVVRSRTQERWGAGVVGPFAQRQIQMITLECIETFADGVGNQIGFVSEQAITRGVFTDDQGANSYEYPTPTIAGLTIGPGYFPLMQVSLAVVRNTALRYHRVRPEVTGVNRAAACATSPHCLKQVRKADERGDSITSGQMNTYFARTSVFTMLVRPAGTDASGNEYAWDDIGEQFAIRGSSPVDQYNYFRVVHPETREYEFRFLPKNGADIGKFSPEGAQFWLLDTRIANYRGQGVNLTGPYSTRSGSFTLQAAGRLISREDAVFAPEMSTGLQSASEARPIINAPQEIIVSEFFPDIDDESAKATDVGFVGVSSNPPGTRYRQFAWYYEMWGQPRPENAVRTYRVRHNNLSGGRWLELEYTGIADQYLQAAPYTGWRQWRLTDIKVIASSGGMKQRDQFNCRIPISPSNPRNPTTTAVGAIVQITGTTTTDGPGGRENGYGFEVLGNADEAPRGQRREVEFELSAGNGKTTRVRYSALCEEAGEPQKQAFGVQNRWNYAVVSTVPNSTTGDWARGERITDTRTVSADNPWRDPGTQVGAVYQVGAIAAEQEVLGLSAERLFEEAAGVTDMSYYTERSTSNASGPEHEIVYVNETVQSDPRFDKLTSCALAMRSGREFSRVDQLRAWLANGAEVKRFHPDEAGTIGPSNMLPDLVYHLMTDKTAGIGDLVSEELLDLPSFGTACTFLRTNKLFFNGAVSEPVNLRSYITELAPFFLMDFAILNGKFSFSSAVPMTPAGVISTGAVPVAALFTEGSIIEDSFQVSFLEDQRRDFIAVMRWREEQVNKLPQEQQSLSAGTVQVLLTTRSSHST